MRTNGYAVPRPPLPVSLIKSRMRYTPSMECIKSFGSLGGTLSVAASVPPPAGSLVSERVQSYGRG